MLNRVVLMGRLVADPELKTTNTGISVTSFRIAVDRNYVKAGEARRADFFDVVAWRSSAEFVCRNFGRGSLIAIDGQLQSRQYVTRDGHNRTAIEIVAENVSFTGERRDNRSNYNIPEGSQIRRYAEDGGSQDTPGYADNVAGFQGIPSDGDLPF